jgi:tRNA(fMet)-specific endonuclease VapC
MESPTTENQSSRDGSVSFLVDTDICSAYMKGDHHVWQRFMQYRGQLHVSAVTVGELFTWALRAKVSPKRLPTLLDLLNDLTVLDVTTDVGRTFGALRAALFDAGQAAPDMDLLIAATALVHDLILVTHNVQDFMHLSGLTVQDWLGP